MEREEQKSERPRPRADLPEAAQRALQEAEQRRKRQAGNDAAAREIGGRKGPDPVRFGDWEVKGIATDF